MAYDFDMQIQRYYRRPNSLFPLNVIVDREGNVAYLGGDFDAASDAARDSAAR